jgi:hypothetical protein
MIGSNEVTGYIYLELFVDRAIMTAPRGGDPSADIAEADLEAGVEVKQCLYVLWARTGVCSRAPR